LHELSLVCSICEVINNKVAEYGADRVTEVRLVMGELSGIDETTLKSCFEMIAQSTPAEGAEMLIKRLPIKLRCRACGNEYESGIPFGKCPLCGGESIEIISGNELYIDSIAVE